MSTINGIWTQPATLSATAQSSSSSSSSSSNSATITANEFLTLLVTELKNQDPTSSSDPNEYINQLVGINSLEQLITVNQNLETGFGISSSSSSSSASASSGLETGAGSTTSQWTALNTLATDSSSASYASSAVAPAQIAAVNGNLSLPASSGAASRLATALSER